MTFQRVAAIAIILASLGSSSSADDAAPVLRPQSWAPRVGDPLELRPTGPSAESLAVEDVRVIVRSRGAQGLIEPQRTRESGPGFWRFAPRHEGTCVIATTIEPARPAAGGRILRYEKLFVRVAPKDPEARAVVRPSASATARFAHRLELAPLVDPACLLVGADLPIRVKFEGLNLKGATVVAKCEPNRGAAEGPSPGAPMTADQERAPKAARGTPLRLTTNDSASVNVPIRSAGLWTITIEHRPGGGEADGRDGDRLVATMMFLVTEADQEEVGGPQSGRKPH